MSRLDARCQSRAWDSLRALSIQLLELSLVLGCIFFIKTRATNQARELSWVRACALVRDGVRLINRPVSNISLQNMISRTCFRLQKST